MSTTQVVEMSHDTKLQHQYVCLKVENWQPEFQSQLLALR